tara:strand:- start:1535 stop:1795 length:261 start_codon:yes stop_codon:yes gene_type:complete
MSVKRLSSEELIIRRLRFLTTSNKGNHENGAIHIENGSIHAVDLYINSKKILNCKQLLTGIVYAHMVHLCQFFEIMNRKNLFRGER